MHNIFNTYLYLKKYWSDFGITEELPENDALRHRNM